MKRNNPRKPSIHFHSRQAWRAWLKTNHIREKGIWMLLYKKHLNRGLSYTDAVEEALCFGWIDGQLHRIDDKRHILWFCPRRKGSVWAESNVARVKRLIKEKRMTAAGLAVFRPSKTAKTPVPSVKTKPRIVLPPKLRSALIANRKAWMHFQNYPKSFRRTAIWWVNTAKGDETRLRRIRAVVKNAAANARPKY